MCRKNQTSNQFLICMFYFTPLKYRIKYLYGGLLFLFGHYAPYECIHCRGSSAAKQAVVLLGFHKIDAQGSICICYSRHASPISLSFLLFLIRGECQQNKWSCATKWNFYHISGAWLAKGGCVRVSGGWWCLNTNLHTHPTTSITQAHTQAPPPFITGHIEGVKFGGRAGNQWKGSIWRGSKVSHSVWFCFIASQHC